MKPLTHREERAWNERVHALHLAALRLRQEANEEERAYREYIKEKYGATPKPDT